MNFIRIVFLVGLAGSLAGCEAVLDVGDPMSNRPCGDKNECLPGYRCTNAICVVAPFDIGGACTGDPDCNPGGEACFTEANGWPGGYCSRNCALDADCPTGSHCGPFVQSGKTCVQTCSASTGCRSGYGCTDTDHDGQSECIPVAAP